MSRPKKEKEEEIAENNNLRDKVFSVLRKEYGDEVLVPADEFKEKYKERLIIPFSPKVDMALGGGIPEGSWVVVSGKQKTGKTGSILSFCSNCQKPENGGKHVYYLNIEGRLKDRDIYDVLDPAKTDIVSSSEDKIYSAKDYLNISEHIINNHPGCVVVQDSVSMLVHEKELEEGIGTSTRGGGAALFAQFCRQMATTVPVKKTILVCVLQLMANTSGYGAHTVEKGGNAVQYQVDVKLKTKNAEDWMVGDRQVGKIVNWVVETTALNSAPNQEVQSWLRFGKGIDDVYETMMIGIELGLIAKSGAWYTTDFLDGMGKTQKYQGGENLYQALISNPSDILVLKQKIKEMIG